MNPQGQIYPIAEGGLQVDSNFVGGKAANLMMLHSYGAPTPRGFVLDCQHTFLPNRPFKPESLTYRQIQSYIRWLAEKSGKTWNSAVGTPLVVSARSGAPVSMPGMMETTLNIGLTKDNLARFSDNEIFAKDCYRRLIQMFGTNSCEIPASTFHEVFEAAKTFYLDMDGVAYDKIITKYEEIFKSHVGEKFPEDPNVQLIESVNAVFASWNSDKAKSYREIENIPYEIGTSCTIMEMVFGNRSENSGTGVVFSHDPNTGVKGLYGDFLAAAQGEDVVAGTHTTLAIGHMETLDGFDKAYSSLTKWVDRIQSHCGDIVDIEFTVEDGKLYLLQWRVAKRSRKASLRFVTDSLYNKSITPDVGIKQLEKLLPVITSTATSDEQLTKVGAGEGVTDGVVVAAVAIGHEAADKFAAEGVPYIYVANDTSPDDNKQMNNAVGILTAHGGKVSHAALIARAWEKTCVVGFDAMQVFDEEVYVLIGDFRLQCGDLIKIDGTTGGVWC